ncbi:CLUMA_CG006560, isoform A [Clunio marinus]|uniref:Coiled-coil domain-containing protein 22 homolog n=1 Tax=Clunio marinus TaxID=568069 RepID=A0A1J1HY26_9DIPT|nr:CLUMA_CG006560, isoform A [Clunio marinus]
MDEVDKIIFQSLRDIECDYDDNVNLKSLTPEEIYEALRKLCKLIKPDIEISGHLPTQVALRFAAASELVKCCKLIGYKGDLGYQTILYSNPIELRRILMWLIEHLPKFENKTDLFIQITPENEAKTIENVILRKISFDFKMPWILEYLQSPSNVRVNPLYLENPNDLNNMDSNDDYLEFQQRFALSIFHQTSVIAASVIATHDRDVFKKKYDPSYDSSIAQKFRTSPIRPNASLNLSTSSPSSVKSVTTSRDTENNEINKSQTTAPTTKTKIEIFNETIEKLQQDIEVQEETFRKLTFEKENYQGLIERELKRHEELKRNNKLKVQAAMLLDNPNENIEALREKLTIAIRKRETIERKFDFHKKPLCEQLESINVANKFKLQEIQDIIENTKKVKGEIRQILNDTKCKLDIQKTLQTELSHIKRITERSSYTSRILDVVKNIERQDHGINDILKDTKTIQKAINTAEGQLQRQFTVTEDLIWNKTNTKDEYSKKTYKLLISLHTEFSELIKLIERTGTIQREIRELKDHIDNEKQHNIQNKLSQITRDLLMVTEKNS